MSATDQRLLIVTGDTIAALMAKGWQQAAMLRYYNPAGRFTAIRFLNWQSEPTPPGWDGLLLDTPPDAAVAAWRAALGDAMAHDTLHDAALTAGWPGLPESWLMAARAFAPHVVRGYDADAAGWIARELGRALGVPALVSVHNVRGIGRPVVRDADLMCVTETVAARCISEGADPARVVHVPNRVDRERFTPSGPVAAGPDGAPKLLCIGRDVPQKNLDRLLQACAIAREKLPALALVHCGASGRDWSPWPFATHIESVPNDAMPGWMRWADALVLPSLWEGFGIVIVEALACGLPVITSNRAPMNGLVHDRWDGLLCDPKDPRDIARAIIEIADPATRARLAAPARTASEPYDIARVEQREAALYDTLTRGEWPRLSIVLPTHNRRALVEGALHNVLAQDYPALELVVVNDGSSDGTRELLDDLASRLRDGRLRIVHQANAGLPAALNAGFAQATGALLGWTSDDNAYRPGALRALARELMMDPALGMIFADYELVREDGRRETVATGPAHELAERNVVGACFLYRREVARQVGDYNAGLSLAEDWDYWRRIAAIAPIRRLPRVLYEYGDTPDSLSRTRPAEVLAAALRMHGVPARWDAGYHDQMVRLAGAYKTQGLAWRSLATACSIVRHRPGSLSGYKAVARALVPMPLLRFARRIRGADGG